MKQAKLLILTFLAFWAFQSTAQESVPYSLKTFIEEFGYFVDEYIEQNESNINYMFERGPDYFLNVNDTLLWPDNFELVDNYYKHRLGLKEYYQVFKGYKTFESDDFYYGSREIDNIELVKSKSGKYFDKYRIYVTENHIFLPNEFESSDSTVQFANYFDVISWFNPNTEAYEWRINKIYEDQTKSWITPQMWTAETKLLLPSLNVDGVDFNSQSGFRAGTKANWIVGGKKYINFTFVTGLYFDTYSFSVEKEEWENLNSGLNDKDNYPFTLNSRLTGFEQKLSLQALSIPFQFKLNNYFRNKKQSVGVYAGANLHLPISSNIENKSGEITYFGEYEFDFYPETIILDQLPNYGFKNYKINELASEDIKPEPFFISLEIGGEFNWYLGKKWVANVSAGFIQSVTPVYKTEESKTLTYNIEGGNKFTQNSPALNSFLTLNDETLLSAANFGVGISYLINKPVIPHGRVGYRNGEISKLAKNRLVTTGTSFTQKSTTKSVTVFLSDVRAGLGGSRVKYSYIGPTPKFYKGGRIIAGAKKGNKLSLQVPSSNSGAFLFFEEPYGFQLEPQGIEYTDGGLYGEIKKIAASDIWEGSNNQRNLIINYRRLPGIKLFVLSYKYSFDNSGIIRTNLLNQVRNGIQDALNENEIGLVYVVSDQPQAWFFESNNDLEQYLPEVELKLTNTDETSANIEGLKRFLSDRKLNPRRDIEFNLEVSEEFLDQGKEMVETLAKTLNIDNNFVDYSTTIHSYGRLQSLDYESSLEFLRKAGTVKQQ